MEALILTTLLAFLVVMLLIIRSEEVAAKRYKSAMIRIARDIEVAAGRAAKLKGQTPDEERQILFALEYLRIAKANLSYGEQLMRGAHPSASRPGEIDWALCASELALTFAERRVVTYEMLNV
jgi:hypothetical protein